MPSKAQPTDFDHVTIDGSEYCLLGSGIAARVTMQTQTELIVLTDSVVRATWLLGGQWDGGRHPWFTPTPNPIEIELRTTDPRWNPAAINFYNPQPLRTILSVWLAERDTFAPVWYADRRAVGVVLDWRVEPAPRDVPATVVITGIDHTTTMADATLEERGEEIPYDRLLYIANRTKGIYPQLHAPQLAGPTVGRIHPTQNMTALDHAVDVALAAECALFFFPFLHPTDPTIHTMMENVLIENLGAPGGTWLASTDPAAGAVSPGPGSAPVLGDATLVACIDAIAVAKSDAGFRTRIDAARDVAYWLLWSQSLIGSAGAGSYASEAPKVPWEAGDQWTLTYDGGVNWTGGVPVIRPYYWTGGNAQYADDRPYTLTGQGFVTVNRITSPAAYALPTMGYVLIIPGGGTVSNTYGTVRVERSAGTGPPVVTVSTTGDEATNGIRALTGFLSPIARQSSLDYWAPRALAWMPNPHKQYPSLLKSSSSSAHPSPGARQWALHLLPGARLALALDTVTYPPPFLPSLTPWVVAIAFTLERDSITLDLTCAPPTMNN